MKTLKHLALLSLAALVLGACDTGGGVGSGRPNPTPAPPAAALPNPISGQFENYTGTGSNINIRSKGNKYNHRNIGRIEADGSFTLTLPEPTAAELTPIRGSDWDGGFTSDLNANFVEVDLSDGGLRLQSGGRVFLNTTGNVAAFFGDPEGSLYGNLFYVDRPVRMQHSNATMSINVNFAAGWNIFAFEVVYDRNGTFLLDVRNATLDEVKWWAENN